MADDLGYADISCYGRPDFNTPNIDRPEDLWDDDTKVQRRGYLTDLLGARWYIELPIRSPLDERTREGDDHPARLFLRFATHRGEKRAMEVIWGNRLRPGEYKYIGGFAHFVADAGDDRVGRWLDEKMDLARVYSAIWKDAAPAHLVDIAVFCDSDDTHTASVSYFDYVRLERR